MYEITVNRASELVHVTLGGLMTVEEVNAYVGELKRQFISHRLRSYALILDVSNCPIQSQDMIKAMGAHMAGMPKAHRIAVVVGSSLAKMQVRRLFTQPYSRIVDNIAEARRWAVSSSNLVV